MRQNKKLAVQVQFKNNIALKPTITMNCMFTLKGKYI